MMATFLVRVALSTSAAALLVSCGGGGGDSAGATGAGAGDDALVAVASADDVTSQPVPHGLSATCRQPEDGVEFDTDRGFTFTQSVQVTRTAEWVNYLRCLGGLPAVARQAKADDAAGNHARYLVANDSNAHQEDPAAPGYTGVTPGDRMRYTGYVPQAWGEVLSRTGPIAREAHEGLVAAIYHRLLMLSPEYSEVGVAVERDAVRNTASTVIDYGAPTLSTADPGLAIVYPSDGQTQVPVQFDSDLETPDPMPEHGIVGYPVSVQSGRGTHLLVDGFRITRADGGAALAATVRGQGTVAGMQTDARLRGSEAFLIPVGVLEPDTEYRVEFSGSVDGAPLTRSWVFHTAAKAPFARINTTSIAVGQYARVRLSGCGSTYRWSFTEGLNLRLHTANWIEIQAVTAGAKSITITDTCGGTGTVALTVR